MIVDPVTRWAEARGLEAIAQVSGEGMLVPVDGETGVWTTQITAAGGWLLLQGMVDLDVDAADLPGVLRYVAMVNQIEPVGTLTVDVRDGTVGTRVAAVLPEDADDLPAVLDAAWEASVQVTDRWVPGARDVASGIDPDAAIQRVGGSLGGVR